MKMNNLGKIIAVTAIVGIVGFAATSFAGWGRGWGSGGYCLGQGSGWGGGATGYQGNLSAQDFAKLNKERQAFFEDTRGLRENLYQKELELRSELAKQDPDAAKAATLQKEVSDLQSQLNQKRIEHRIKMQKENPEFFADRGYGGGYGYGPRGGMGYGPGPRGGMGYGPGPRGGMGYGPHGGMGMGGYGPGYGSRGFGMGRGFAGGGGCWY
jgi:zinc resistance-associated protein